MQVFFSSLSKNGNRRVPKEYFPPQCSSVHIECSFDDADKIYSTRCSKNFGQNLRVKKKPLFSGKCFAKKCFSGYLECSFDSFEEELLPLRGKVFVSISEIVSNL